MNRFELLLGLTLAAEAVLTAGASGRAIAAEEGETTLDVDALLKEVESGDPSRILAALKTVETSKDPAGAPVVVAVLNRGANTEVLVASFDAAAKIKAEATSQAIAPYLRHRIPDVRRGAVGALLKSGGPEAAKALTRALRSRDPVVRGIAATGLGTLGAHESLEDLFKAFTRDVNEAAASIGLLCTPEECDRFVAFAGKKPFDVMVSGYDQILFRAPKDIPDEHKLRLVGRLREQGTTQVAQYLADVADRWPKEWDPKVKAAIESAARSSGGAK